jgi:hypothetical protein
MGLKKEKWYCGYTFRHKWVMAFWRSVTHCITII